MRAPWIHSFFFALFFIFPSIAAQAGYFFPTTTANLSTTWTNNESSIPSSAAQPSYFFPTTTNNESSIPSTDFSDGSRIRVILGIDGIGDIPSVRCGFFCNGTCTSYLFAIVVNLFNYNQKDYPEVIWSANRDNPVGEGASLNFTAAGELVLHDVDGSIVWTTNTSGKSVAGMNLTDEGNLMLFDGHNSMVWQSFDHPTDCLVAGQKLLVGQKLLSSGSSTNLTAQKDSYSLQLTNEGLFASIETNGNPLQVYFYHLKGYVNYTSVRSYVQFVNGSLSFVYIFLELGNINFESEILNSRWAFSPESPYSYMKLMPDGQLKAFGWSHYTNALAVANLLSGPPEECDYPLACGRNAICFADKQCSCPGTGYFRAVNDREPNMGCSQVTPLTCNATKDQDFIEIKNIKYLTYNASMKKVNAGACKQACLNNCSCKAALFEYGLNSTSGDCYLLSEIFTMMSTSVVRSYNTSAFIKIQNVRSFSSSRKNSATVIGAATGSFVLLIVVVGFTTFIVQKQKRNSKTEEEYLNQVPGMPTRFSYEELKTATNNFSKKLGEGGFGSVFEGILEDGSRIAVKCLQGLVHLTKSFTAEVESIGNIHHVNLVRLKGFSSWKSERLLVYEFMSNGSLDQWIYSQDRNHVLEWGCRKKIILDIAKGLAYLHEDCSQKIIHLDIKPQNILLDDDFNAKISDFGLSKLIDKNQSRQVMTTMRGTPGYMAPEWLSSFITEKVDVYSFGIVLLEILCGRRNFDRFLPEESWHLLRVFQSCWEEGTLLSIVDRYSEDMQVHGTEVMEMMKVASWCLQTDFTKRPSMSTVIKVLEGVISAESNLDYNFLYARLQESTTVEHEKSSKPVVPSILSGPR